MIILTTTLGVESRHAMTSLSPLQSHTVRRNAALKVAWTSDSDVSRQVQWVAIQSSRGSVRQGCRFYGVDRRLTRRNCTAEAVGADPANLSVPAQGDSYGCPPLDSDQRVGSTVWNPRSEARECDNHLPSQARNHSVLSGGRTLAADKDLLPMRRFHMSRVFATFPLRGSHGQSFRRAGRTAYPGVAAVRRFPHGPF